MPEEDTRKRRRLVLVYCLWAAAVLVALLFARAHYLRSVDLQWNHFRLGHPLTDHTQAVLRQGIVVAIVICSGLTILVGIFSRVALYCIIAMAAAFSALLLLGQYAPYNFRLVLAIPQIPGLIAAVVALGFHGDENLFAWWTISINTVFYAPIVFNAVVRRTTRSDKAVRF